MNSRTAEACLMWLAAIVPLWWAYRNFYRAQYEATGLVARMGYDEVGVWSGMIGLLLIAGGIFMFLNRDQNFFDED
jgi:hypothetical protein